MGSIARTIGLNQRAIVEFGRKQRLDKGIEECIELAHVLTVLKKKNLTVGEELPLEERAALVDELVDVKVMIDCITNMYGITYEELNIVNEQKLDKFELAINEGRVILR